MAANGEEIAEAHLSTFLLTALDKAENDFFAKFEKYTDPKRKEARRAFSRMRFCAKQVSMEYLTTHRYTALQYKLSEIHSSAEAEIRLWHKMILRRMHRTPSHSSPWICKLQRDLPQVIFEHICEMLTTNNFGISVSRKNSTVTLSITELKKAKSIFRRVMEDKVTILERVHQGYGCSKIIVTSEIPFEINYTSSPNRLVVVVSCKYGLWNDNGVQQH